MSPRKRPTSYRRVALRKNRSWRFDIHKRKWRK